MKGLLTSVVEVVKVDEHTVRMRTDGPNPLLPNNLTNLSSWTASVRGEQGHPAAEPTRPATRPSRCNNGTGPSAGQARARRAHRARAQRGLLGQGQLPDGGEQGRVHPGALGRHPRRGAGLPGEVDFLLDLAVQDLERLSAASGIVVRSWSRESHHLLRHEPGCVRTAHLGHQGQEPLRGQARARGDEHRDQPRGGQRVACAPVGARRHVAPPFIDGYDKRMDVVPAPDVARAKAPLAEAGYPDGFSVTPSRPNDRYVNDEAICQAATGMFGQIGVKARLDARPKTSTSPSCPRASSTSTCSAGACPPWTRTTSSTTSTRPGRTRAARGTTGYSSPRVDELTKAMNREIDLGKRAGMVAETWKTVQDDVSTRRSTTRC